MSKMTKVQKLMKALKIGGDYKALTDFMKKKRIYTKSDLIQEGVRLGKTESAATGSAGVMISPRKSSNRGRCTGNMSNPWGHLAYNEKLKRKTNKDGEQEEQRFQFRYRTSPLPRKTREPKEETKAVKVKVKVKTKAPTTKVKAKATTKVKKPAEEIDLS
jgi:hypothetical protein